MPKRPKLRLLIDIRIPDERGHRMTIRGDDLTVKPDALAEWVPVCERIMGIVAEHFGRGSPTSEADDAR